MGSQSDTTEGERGPDPVNRDSGDAGAERLEALRELYPEVFSEGHVDLDKLRAVLGDDVDDSPERYSFTWAGKRDAIRLLQTPSRATLTPARDESVEFDATQHVFIEGENLETLKLLRKAYAGQVKMIYIDPPYNTGNDFIYPDDFSDPLGRYLQLTGQADEAGNLLTSNPETSGRYHSAWLSMMYPRLVLARQLLRDDGVIFVSIDDHEVHNLRLLMNEIFGEENFLATFMWEKRTTRENRRVFSFNHDFIVAFARQKSTFEETRGWLPMGESARNRYKNPDRDPRGDWQSVSLNAQAGHGTAAQFYEITTPSGRRLKPPPGRCWSVTSERLSRLIEDNRVWFGEKGDGVPRLKLFLSEARSGLTPHTLWKADEVGTTDSARKELIELFAGLDVFDTPKPVALVQRLLQIATDAVDDDIVVDFFAGAGVTPHAVLAQNAVDGGTRRFIAIQMPEPATGRAASAAALQTVADVCKARLSKAADRLTTVVDGRLAVANDHGPDVGRRVFKLAPPNFRQWEPVDPDDPEGLIDQMGLFVDPLVDGWEPEDVLWEVALREGYTLHSRVEQLDDIAQNTVWRVTDPDKQQSFLICLDQEVQEVAVAALRLSADDLFVCRDVALSDTLAANLALQCRLKTI